MNWGLLSTVFFLATFKFLFAPFTGNAIGLPFWETYLSSALGGVLSATIFYFFSEWIIHYTHERKIKKMALNQQSKPLKKKFTKTNKTIIRVKHSLGIYGICFLAPLFLSVPIGSIIAAKFYGKQKKTFPLIVLGMFLNSLIVSSLSYLLFD